MGATPADDQFWAFLEDNEWAVEKQFRADGDWFEVTLNGQPSGEFKVLTEAVSFVQQRGASGDRLVLNIWL